MAISSKRAYATRRSATLTPLLLWPIRLTHTSVGDTRTQFWLSFCGVSGSWCVQALFEPSEHHWQVWGLILNVISSLLPSCWCFSFALGHGVSFLDGIQHSPFDGCSAVSCNFGVLAGEDECTSFYSAILQTSAKLSWETQMLSTNQAHKFPECQLTMQSLGHFQFHSSKYQLLHYSLI